MGEATELNGHSAVDEAAGDLEASLPGGDPAMVEIEVTPVGETADACDGAVVRLVSGEGTASEVSLAAGLSGPQCREVARQLLIVADGASRGTERTLLVVTAPGMWRLPGQALVVRCTPDPHFEFLVKPRGSDRAPRLARPARKLIVPGR
jgi:hypothetical protein